MQDLTSFIVNKLGVVDVVPVCKGELCITHLVAWPVSWSEGRATYAAEKCAWTGAVDLAEQDTCCGFGGTFSVKMAENPARW